MEPARSALIVASDDYQDPMLRALRAPAKDAEELARVLSDPVVGNFDVAISLNEPEYKVRRRLDAFFSNRRVEDLLILHLSCHGLKDDDGRLYFATADTEYGSLDSTSVPADFVNRHMSQSRSRRIVLLLDCCYSGAFASSMLSKGDEGVHIKERFEGRGRVVLTASNSMEYAFEGGTLSGAGKPSVFTTALVKGLETGEADRDKDNMVSVDELYDYVYDAVRETTPNQTPGKWTFDLQGELYIARNPHLAAAELPGDLKDALESSLAGIRSGAVRELDHLLHGSHSGLALAARVALEKLKDDDSLMVRAAAGKVLTTNGGPGVEPEPVLAVDPPGLDFGRVSAGQTYTEEVRIRNTGGGQLNWHYERTGDFFTAQRAGDSLRIELAGEPGSHRGSLRIRSGGGEARVEVAADIQPTRETIPATDEGAFNRPAMVAVAGAFLLLLAGTYLFQDDWWISLEPFGVAIAVLLCAMGIVQPSRRKPLITGLLLGFGTSAPLTAIVILEARSDALLQTETAALMTGSILVLAAGIAAFQALRTTPQDKGYASSAATAGIPRSLRGYLEPYQVLAVSGVGLRLARIIPLGGFEIFKDYPWLAISFFLIVVVSAAIALQRVGWFLGRLAVAGFSAGFATEVLLRALRWLGPYFEVEQLSIERMGLALLLLSAASFVASALLGYRRKGSWTDH